VAIVGDGRAPVRTAAILRPQVIVVDIGMRLLNGLDAAYQVKRLLGSVKLVFLTMNSDPALAARQSLSALRPISLRPVQPRN
jgi:DNA-binding NarL/FixJ family response regulator